MADHSISIGDWALIAQAIAATIALGVGVGVPIWQRYNEDKGRRADELARRKERAAEVAAQLHARRERAYSLVNLFAKLFDQTIRGLVSGDVEDKSRRYTASHVIEDLLSASSRVDLYDLSPDSAEAFVRIRGIALAAITLMQSSASGAHVAGTLNATIGPALWEQSKAMNDATPEDLRAPI